MGLGSMGQGPLCAEERLRRRGERLQRGLHLRLLGWHRGRLMRHFLLLPLAVRGLAGGMGMPAVQRALVTPSGLSHRLPPCSCPARLTAVALASVTPAAQEELPQALSSATHHETQCFHAPPRRVALFWRGGPKCATSLSPAAHLALPGRASRQAFQVQLEGLPFFQGHALGHLLRPTACPQLFSLPQTPSHSSPATSGAAHLAGSAHPGRRRRWRSGIPVER